jgi:hypothetical protein
MIWSILSRINHVATADDTPAENHDTVIVLIWLIPSSSFLPAAVVGWGLFHAQSNFFLSGE